jgi:hypothetical protein
VSIFPTQPSSKPKSNIIEPGISIFEDSEDENEFATPSSPWLSFTVRHSGVQGPGRSSANSSCLSLTLIRQRLSRRSTRYAEMIWSVVNRCTLTGTTIEAPPTPSSHEQAAAEWLGTNPGLWSIDPTTHPGLSVPGDYLAMQVSYYRDPRWLCTRVAHDSGACWCTVATAPFMDEHLWVSSSGSLSSSVEQVLQHPGLGPHLRRRDCFGHTVLHLFALLNSYREDLLALVMTVGDAELSATNTAGQTFLHLLEPGWFQSSNFRLMSLLTRVSTRSPDLIYVTDVYGRNFFHRLKMFTSDQGSLQIILKTYGGSGTYARDAFNRRLDRDGAIDEAGYAETIHSSQSQSSWLKPSGLTRLEPSRTDPQETNKLLGTLRSMSCTAIHPFSEDNRGRNGLQWLAEAVIDGNTSASSRPGTCSPDLAPKRKRSLWDIGRRDSEASRATSCDTKSVSSSSSSSSNGAGPDSPRLASRGRLQLLRDMLAAGHNPNHYDKQGWTVLMSFIEHLKDDHNDPSLRCIFHSLIDAGANVEARNSHGETALLMAARRGRKVALGVLLDRDASVHVRDIGGRGVLETVTKKACQWKKNAACSGPYEACKALVLRRRRAGAVMNPTVMEEWGVPGLSF